MEFMVLIGGAGGGKFVVQAEPIGRHPDTVGFVGIYNRDDGKTYFPYGGDISCKIPYRYRAAFHRSTARFWFDNDSYIENGRIVGAVPYLPLYSSRNKYMTTLYAIPRDQAEAAR